MAQLKMYRLKGAPVEELTLPEGYSISTYKTEDDKLAWVECCKNGLVGDAATAQQFDDDILGADDIDVYSDCLFLDYQGEHIGTITAIYHPDGNYGQVHMVGLKTEFRGKGLGKYMNNAAVRKLDAQGADYIYLTTDEWRKGAVKSYLSAGFIPVEYDEGMTQRWEWELCQLGVDSVDMVCEDCSFCKTLRKAKTVRIGVVGVGRGRSMLEYVEQSKGVEVVAICDSYKVLLDKAIKDYEGQNITFYDNYDEFLGHDMDAVILANYATEHAPFAIKALGKGFHVVSEVLPVQTMKEAVELVEAVEKSDKNYYYAENYCYMPSTKRMRELYREGLLGEFEYGEGEYMHNCEPDWHYLTFGNPDHWRNTMHACYYCTHSIGPLIHITGMRPVKVSGFEGPFNARMERMGAKAGPMGMEIITLENGAILKSIHGVGPSRNSVWYSIYGSKGRMESAREDAGNDDANGIHGVQVLYTNVDDNEGDARWNVKKTFPRDSLSRFADGKGHGGGDYYQMFNIIESIRGNEADVIDVYEALDMFLPGMFAYRSVLQGGIPLEIPNLRNKEERDLWRNDTQCTSPEVAGDMLVPSYSKGNPEIPQENYEILKEKFEEKLRKEAE